MKKEIKNNIRNASVITILCVGFVVGLVFLANLGNTVTEEKGWVRQYVWNAVGDRNPGASASGWLNMSVNENTSTPSTYFARNLTNNASSYAWTNTNNTHGGSDVPHSTEFAIVYKIRVNTSDAYSSGNTTWMPTWVRCNITSAVLGLADVGMDRYVIGDNATYMWLHFVYNDGVSISQGQNVTTCQFYVDIYQ